MKLSCCAWALPGTHNEVVDCVVDLGFQFIDLQPFAYAGKGGHRLSRAELEVCCIAASVGIHKDLSLESDDLAVIAAALQHLDIVCAYGAHLGATTAYVVPSMETVVDRKRYADTLVAAADIGSKHGIRLAVEHFPGRALSTAAATVQFLDEIDHPNLYLLFDLGHAQMSHEDPVAALEAAGPRLGYIHLDDNDGVADSHLALLDGVMTENSLRCTLETLSTIGYTGPVSLELNPTLPDSADALRRSRIIVQNLTDID